ncbi:hypothetical protein [Synechococcus sp. MU1648]|uniref:hypothetical protein n=1 Tax=Synechococcus sp. MU1648 TaxID=2508351 RepID=UPI0020270B3A|nr:hypothetical protein [Synechococcus sp. MU1648]
MASLLQKIKDSIDKLNKVDVGAQLSKLKDIKIEDLKNIKFSDLRGTADPMTLSVVGSVVLLGAGLYCFTLPEWRSWGLNAETLQQYRSEAEQVPILRASLADLQKQKDELGEEFDLVHDFVSEESVELFTSKFFTETARRSNVRLLGVNPLPAGVPYTCIQPDQNDFSFDQSLSPDFSSGQEPTGDLEPPADSVASSPPSSDLARIFKVNRFQLSLRGDYLNVIDYLRYLNQYKQTLSPVCFEVFATPIQPSPEAASGGGSNPEPRYVGEVTVKLIVDIPQRQASATTAPISNE